MAERDLAIDLFGDPVLPRREGRGRPEVVWDRAISNRVLLCFARGLTVADTAKVAGISTPTLRKVYFSECGKRKDAALRLEMRQLALLADEAENGNVGASKELLKQVERLRMRDRHQAEAPAPKAKQPKLGKKEAAAQAARAPTELYDPPAPPTIQ